MTSAWLPAFHLRRYNERKRSLSSGLIWFGERLVKRTKKKPASFHRFGLSLYGYYNAGEDTVIISGVLIDGALFQRERKDPRYWMALVDRYWTDHGH